MPSVYIEDDGWVNVVSARIQRRLSLSPEEGRDWVERLAGKAFLAIREKTLVDLTPLDMPGVVITATAAVSLVGEMLDTIAQAACPARAG